MVTLLTQIEPIPGYRLVERLGKGGFGEVWKAEAPGGIPKAIKFVNGNINDLHNRNNALQELKSLNRVKTVHHPFILGLERMDVIDGQLLIVMELADRDLSHRLRECQEQGLPGIPREELLRYMEETAEALDLMNIQHGLQHLDIKPQNLFLVRNHIKVADFGLVKDLQGIQATVTSGVTPVYAAPETFEGKVMRSSDQYSLAIVYQEMLTGVRPFKGTSARQLLMQHVTTPPDLTALPAAEQPIIGRALAKVAADRFPSCADLVRALRQVPAGALGTAPPGQVPGAPSEIAPSAKGRRTLPNLDVTMEEGPPARRKARATLNAFEVPDEEPRLNPALDTPRNEMDFTPSSQAEIQPADPFGRRLGQKDAASVETVGPVPASKSLALQTPRPQGTDAPCPRCGTPLIDPGPSAWCGNCGYSRDLETARQLFPTEKKKGKDALGFSDFCELLQVVPWWLVTLLAGCVVVMLGNASCKEILPARSWLLLMVILGEFALGLLLYLIAHGWVMILGSRELREFEPWKHIDPTSVWRRAFELMPAARKPLCLASWGATAIACALVIGLMNGFTFESKPAPRPTGDGSLADVRLKSEAPEERKAATNEEPREGDHPIFKQAPDTQDKEEKRFSTRCFVVGYVRSEDGGISKLVLGDRDAKGNVRYAGSVNQVTRSDELEKTLSALLKAPEAPPPAGAPADMKVVWIEPKFTGTVDYGERDSKGVLEKTVLKSLTEAKEEKK